MSTAAAHVVTPTLDLTRYLSSSPRQRAMRAIIDCVKELHPVNVTVTEVTDFWEQQNLVKNFLLENSDEFADLEMCRSVPIFVYADRKIDRELLKAWVADMGFTHLAILPPLKGSWLERMFASHQTPSSRTSFWDRLGDKKIIGNAEKLSILSATVALFGVFVVHSDAGKTTAAAQKTAQASASQQSANTPTTINISLDSAKKNASILVQSQKPEDALKIMMEALKQAQSMQATQPTVPKVPEKRPPPKPKKNNPQKKSEKVSSAQFVRTQAL